MINVNRTTQMMVDDRAMLLSGDSSGTTNQFHAPIPSGYSRQNSYANSNISANVGAYGNCLILLSGFSRRLLIFSMKAHDEDDDNFCLDFPDIFLLVMSIVVILMPEM